jgi:hypothetical protein
MIVISISLIISLGPIHGLVTIAKGLNSIPFRTRSLKPLAPMVLRLKAWESRSLPDFV